MEEIRKRGGTLNFEAKTLKCLNYLPVILAFKISSIKKSSSSIGDSLFEMRISFFEYLFLLFLI